MVRDLSKERWVYLWVDGIYSGLRSEEVKLCSLVVIGVNDQGEKKFLTIEDGVRESTQSWREVLLDLKARGMNVPKLAVGDGALGFWSALDEIYPNTPSPALLGAQERECVKCASEVGTGESEGGIARDLDGRNSSRCTACV